MWQILTLPIIRNAKEILKYFSLQNLDHFTSKLYTVRMTDSMFIVKYLNGIILFLKRPPSKIFVFQSFIRMIFLHLNQINYKT